MEQQETVPFAKPVKLLRLPLAEDEAAAGFGAQTFEDRCVPTYVHETPALRETDILFRVNGDSMTPKYPDHSVLMVKKASDLGYGETGIFSVDGVLFVKQYEQDGLHSVNKKYATMKPDQYGEIRMIGRVLGIMGEEDFATESEIRSCQEQM